MAFDPSEEKLHLYLVKRAALMIDDWDEFVLLDKQQRYLDGFSQDPRFNQDLGAAEAYAESGEMGKAPACYRGAGRIERGLH